MNNSDYREKTSDVANKKTIVVECLILVIGVVFWLVTQTIKTTHDSAPTEATVLELSTVHTAQPKSISSTPLLNEQHSPQLGPLIKQPSFLDQLSTPYGFASDSLHQRLIWTSGGNETFMSANLDGSEVSKIQSNFESPYLIRIETPYGHKTLFYADGSLMLRETDSQLDSSTETILIHLQEHEFHGIGFDDAADTVYIGDHFGRPSLEIRLPIDDKPIVAIPMTLLNLN